MTTSSTIRSTAALWLCFLLVLPNPCPAQQPSDPVSGPTSLTTGRLKILVLEGGNAINSIPNRAATFPVVEVRNENDIPIENADVVFELPSTGPGGVFPDNKTSFAGRTNLQGQVRAPYLMNNLPGQFSIQVRASLGPLSASTVISQTHSIKLPKTVDKTRHWYQRKKLLLIVGGAAAAVTVILLTRASGSIANAGSGTVIVISPGGPSIGVPH